MKSHNLSLSSHSMYRRGPFLKAIHYITSLQGEPYGKFGSDSIGSYGNQRAKSPVLSVSAMPKIGRSLTVTTSIKKIKQTAH